jgi:hypothetical protein
VGANAIRETNGARCETRSGGGKTDRQTRQDGRVEIRFQPSAGDNQRSA